MTVIISTQQVLEPVAQGTPGFRATQVALEVSSTPAASNFIVTQVALEVSSTPAASNFIVTQVALEVLTQDNSLDAPFKPSENILYLPRIGPFLQLPFLDDADTLWTPERGPFLQMPLLVDADTLWPPIRSAILELPFLDDPDILIPFRIRPVYVDWMPQLQTQANPIVAPSLIQNALLPVLPVWPLVAPYGTPVPFATYTITGSEPSLFVSGYSGLSRTDVTIYVTHKRHRDALTALHAVIDALAATEGLRIGHHTIMEATWDPETRLYTIPTEMSVWHS